MVAESISLVEIDIVGRGKRGVLESWCCGVKHTKAKTNQGLF